MNTFTLTDARKMGDPDPQYGQSYWAHAQGSDTPLMFSTNKNIEEGAQISCEESVNKTSKKGQEYLLLRKVQVEVPGFPASDGEAKAASPQAPASKSYSPRDDSAIKAQWAIGQAVALVGHGQIKHEDIEPQAMDLFSMVSRVKTSEAQTEAKPAPDAAKEVAKVFAGADQIEIPSDN